MMLSTDSSETCQRLDALKDYAFDELPSEQRAGMEQHLRQCSECASELERLRMTTLALRSLPDQEIPQRIAFVSDKVFEPSWFARFWHSGARLGFASACVLALAVLIAAWHVVPNRSGPEVRTIVQTAAVPQQQIDAAVAKAVAKVREEDARTIQTAVEEATQKQERQYRSQLVAMQESFYILQKKLTHGYLAAVNTTGEGQ